VIKAPAAKSGIELPASEADRSYEARYHDAMRGSDRQFNT
jgi:hypothetical protein